MARLKGPALVIGVLAILAAFGANVRAYDLGPQIACGYALAELDQPPPDVLFVGSSRYGRGLDPGYIQQRLKSEYGKDVHVERLSLNFPNAAQYRPLIDRLLEQRGAPKVVYLQLFYNFKPDRHRTWDIPVNPPINIAYARVAQLAKIQFDARLNDYDTLLPRQFEAGYQSFVEVLLTKFEASIFSALRYPAKTITRRMPDCTGTQLYKQMSPTFPYNEINDQIAFTEATAERKAELEAFNVEVKTFMPMEPAAAHRKFENAQMQAMIDTLESAGSRVILMTLPALNERDISRETLGQIATVFPGTEFSHPYALYDTAVGDQLAVSFADTHHANSFGALQFSRFFAAQISQLDF